MEVKETKKEKEIKKDKRNKKDKIKETKIKSKQTNASRKKKNLKMNM